ncbi:MAG: hypothetical protein KDA77_22830, partial [Planctomycetaceae bacterium]|nr:hypothetical protein [Planctomycetaceae bacterium]
MASQQQKHHAARRVDEQIKQHAHALCGVRHPFWRLINVIRDRTSLLSPRGATEYATCPADTERIIQTCKRLSCHRNKWYQKPETWTAPDASRFVQMRSLVQHLFDRYPVPNFMASVWWPEYANEWGMSLYLHLATGQSIRRFSDLRSFRVSKKMAALFMQAPDDLRPDAAIRWSQVLALGGDARLARILISHTLLSRSTSDEPFWETVIQFLIRNQPISAE